MRRTHRALAVAVLAALVVAGSLVPLEAAPSTFAAATDGEVARLHLVADVPVGNSCALWSNGTATARLGGAESFFDGCVHGNGDLVVSGARNVFNRTLRHVGALTVDGQGNELRQGDVLDVPRPFPWRFDIADYAPGGRAALRAAEEGRYFVHTGRVALAPPTLAPGLHYVEGAATVSAARGFQGRVTIVATDSVVVHVGGLEIAPYVDGLLVHAGGAGDALRVQGSSGDLAGVLDAPQGEARVLGSATRVRGHVAADRLVLEGARNTFVGMPPAAAQNAAGLVAYAEGPHDDGPRVPRILPGGAGSLLPGGLSVGDFDGDGTPEVVATHHLSEEASLLVVEGEEPVLVVPSIDPANPLTIRDPSPLLNADFTVGWLPRSNRPDAVHPFVYDLTGSVARGTTEPHASHPALGWTYRVMSGDRRPWGDAAWMAKGWVAIRVDPRDSGVETGVLTQFVSSADLGGAWSGPETVVLRLAGVYNGPVTVRALYVTAEDPWIPRVSAPETFGARPIDAVRLRFEDPAEGTMTQFFLAFEAPREAYVLLDALEILGATPSWRFAPWIRAALP